MAARTLSDDWRGKRCRHCRLVWLRQFLSLRDRGLQFHRRGEGHDPSDAELYQ